MITCLPLQLPNGIIHLSLHPGSNLDTHSMFCTCQHDFLEPSPVFITRPGGGPTQLIVLVDDFRGHVCLFCNDITLSRTLNQYKLLAGLLFCFLTYVHSTGHADQVCLEADFLQDFMIILSTSGLDFQIQKYTSNHVCIIHIIYKLLFLQQLNILVSKFHFRTSMIQGG